MKSKAFRRREFLQSYVRATSTKAEARLKENRRKRIIHKAEQPTGKQKK